MADQIKNSLDLTESLKYIAQLSPEALEALEKGLRLHGLKDISELPGSDNPDMISYFIRGTLRLINEHGEEWIVKKRLLLIDQLEYLATLL